MKRIIVGIDGSPGSLTALRWAVEEARARNAPVHVVSAWSFPVYAYSGYIAVPPGDAFEEAARIAMDTAIAEGKAGIEIEGVDVSCALINGGAAAVLIEASQDADLLVVGARGRGGFTELLLGSVSNAVTAHAHCPVVVVHDKPAGTPRGSGRAC
jgi:nucleotide-binding universal stress UspA family protein